MSKVELFIKGLSLKKQNPDQADRIDRQLTKILDSMNLDEVINLARELTDQKIIDFGYPKKTISPTPPRGLFALILHIFRGK
jgi:hypothetical protein